ncbi:MAG: hypothetical protein JJU35_05735 [Balneolales bacterium]|nr:hypothetical protein [Balneolales bacterium]
MEQQKARSEVRAFSLPELCLQDQAAGRLMLNGCFIQALSSITDKKNAASVQNAALNLSSTDGYYPICCFKYKEIIGVQTISIYA